MAEVGDGGSDAASVRGLACERRLFSFFDLLVSISCNKSFWSVAITAIHYHEAVSDP